MGLASEQYEDAARRWDESGRPEPEPSAWKLMMLSCWSSSPGAKHDGLSPRLKEYLRALRHAVEARDAGWLDSVMDGHEYCGFCGQSWRSENCGYCTYCAKEYPPCCTDKRRLTVLPNGNRECSACGKGEIVG